MQLRSGCSFIVSSPLRNQIERTVHSICDVNDLRHLSKENRIITVGDVTTENAISAGINIFLQVVDLKTKRYEAREFKHVPGAKQVENASGTISHDLFMLIRDVIYSGKQSRIEVVGEEDLSVLPIIYYSDDNTVVAYGVPDVGMACLKVNKDLKGHIIEMVERMEVKCQS